MAQFDKYVNLIRKRAHEYSKKYNIDRTLVRKIMNNKAVLKEW